MSLPQTIRIATAADAPALAAFAERTFRDTFGPFNKPDDMDAYCAATFAVEQQRRELADPARLTLVLEQEARLAAYAQLLAGPAPECVTGPGPIEIVRFYVDRSWHGRGFAQALMAEVVAAARRRGARTIYLGVWERNVRAIAYYQKEGFRAVGSHPFVLGTKVDTDLLLVRALQGPVA
jgi:ribosomal protein S18 acetylase RimI-like enzyme